MIVPKLFKQGIFLMLCSACVLVACKGNHAAKSNITLSKADSLEVQKAKTWLNYNLTHFLNAQKPAAQAKELYTDAYFSYKQEAARVGSTGGLTKTQFEDKWKFVYNTKYAGTGNSFLIPTPNHGPIKISQIELKDKTDDGATIFEIVLNDEKNRNQYKRDIKLINAGDNYQIDDVLEYD